MKKSCRFLFLVVSTWSFLQLPVLAGDPPLLKIKDLAPGVVVDLRYATPDNFTHVQLYEFKECLLVEPAAQRLMRVQKNLEKKGLGLKLWDCYRPVSVQEKLWSVFPDARYVANPKTGSKHNRGASVDLTLVDSKGNEIPMPTPFDEFSENAHRTATNLPAALIENRRLLEDAMVAEGWVPLPTEWWHFDDPEWMNYALRNEPIGDPALYTDKKATPSNFSLPAQIKQLVVVKTDAWSATTGQLQRFEKVSGQWQVVGSAWPVSIGLKGMSWGLGLQKNEMRGPAKKEGDLTAPAGVFPIGPSYGLAPKSPSLWPYQQISDGWICVDDPTAKEYNRVLTKIPGQAHQWKSAETLKRSDHLYNWIININQNWPDVIAGCGSCIFFHIWRKENAATEGCTAMSEDNLLILLTWLKTDSQPHLVQLPREWYDTLRERWQLP